MWCSRPLSLTHCEYPPVKSALATMTPSAPPRASNVNRKLAPSIGSSAIPSTTFGSGMPAASRTVGPTSITCVNWARGVLSALIRLGQAITIGSRVPPKWLGADGVPAQPSGHSCDPLNGRKEVAAIENGLARLVHAQDRTEIRPFAGSAASSIPCLLLASFFADRWSENRQRRR